MRRLFLGEFPDWREHGMVEAAAPVQVRSVELRVSECRTRIPFRFGATTFTGAPLCVARARVAVGGVESEGSAADFLVPKWFDKDPDKSASRNIRDLADSARSAAATALHLAVEPRSVFDWWWALYQDRVEVAPEDSGDRLVRGYGVALVERAVIDAVCRLTGESFDQALRADRFGFHPEAVHESLAGWDLAASMPETAISAIQVRHTVGLTDPLTPDEVTGDNAVDDGLPECLVEDIARHGLRCFKLKLSGDHDHDVARLLRVATLFDEHVDGARFTVDGNEQFQDLDGVLRVFVSVARDPAGRRMLEGLLAIEQPLARAITFEPARLQAMSALTGFGPVMIDEADHGVSAFPRALECGYRGVSVKNCKGVFRALINRGLCERTGGDAFQSSEDLTNLPVLPLQQDLATLAAVGLTHSERNGHHYFRGLDHLPETEARAALQRHPDLYEEVAGRIQLRIRNGSLEFGSVHECAGYGTDIPIAMDRRTPLDEWDLGEA